MLTVAQCRALQAAALADPRGLIESAFQIATAKDPPIQRLTFNGPQAKVHKAILSQREAGMPPRIFCLKCRQIGLSTLGEAYMLAMALCRPYSQCLIVGHLDETAEKLFRKVLLMVEGLPEWLRPRFKSTPRKDEVRFADIPCSDGAVELESTIFIGTAAGQEVWRGTTLHAVHLSEFPWYGGAQERVLLGVLPAVPQKPETLVLVEGTAYGAGTCFHREYLRAEAGESDFRAVFIPWFERPDATRQVPPEFQADEEERSWRRAFGLSNEQLQWYRYILHTECQDNKELRGQEHPGTVSEAFLLSGRPAFDTKRLSEMSERARHREPERGEWTDRGFVQMRKGRLAIWERPVEGHDYVIGADIAAGVAGGDYSCAEIIDRETCEVVAVWHGHMNPVDFAGVLDGVGRWYNEAVMAPEENQIGWSVIEELTRRRFYPRFYQMQRVDKIRNAMTNYLGWTTTFRTKGLMIDSMAHAILTGELMIWDTETVQELIEFQYVGRQAEGIRHDDRSMAVMIAWRAHLETPILATGLPPKVVPPTVAEAKDERPKCGRNVDQEVWDDTEREMERMQAGQQQGDWRQWAEPDPEPGDKPFDPPGGYW